MSAGEGDRTATRLVTGGRRADWTRGLVNPPVTRASTMLFASLAELDAARGAAAPEHYYGRRGTPSTFALADALTAVEPEAAGVALFPSGVAALLGAFLTASKAGEHLLLPDNVYETTRSVAALLADMGITTSYYDPVAGLGDVLRPNTTAVLVEAPGSLTFEVPDVPALAAEARTHGACVIADNTWGTPLRFPALTHGVDLSMQAVTKYVGGHSDLLMGAVAATAAWWPRLRRRAGQMGQCVSADDATLALRGLRTLQVRLDRHEASALTVARHLAAHPAVARVLHPALPGSLGHDLFKRDFSGATGLFAIVLRGGTRADTAALVDGLRLFGIGFSWGGFESLALPVEPDTCRTVTHWSAEGPVVRLSIGLEDPADLIADLDTGLARYAASLPG